MTQRRLFLGSALSVVVSLAFGPAALAQSNPVPLINQPLVPEATAPGGPQFTLTVNGTGFVSGSVVNWNGSARSTTFVSGSQLTATVLASDIATPTTGFVTVANPSPGGGSSAEAFFEVTAATSSISLNRSDYAVGSEPFVVATADFNADGKLDLVVSDQSSNSVSVLLGGGDGTFQPAISYDTGSRPKWVTTGDFNGDGKLDLAVASFGDAVSILLGNGDGTFRPYVDYSTGSGAFSLVTGDFNGDGRLDLAVANYASAGTVSVLIGNGDGTFHSKSLSR